MAATDVGIGLHDIGRRSFLKLRRDQLTNPQAVSVNKFVASVDPSTLSAGAALTLTTAGELLLRFARFPTLVLTDASGGVGGLSVTVRFKGYRFGVPVQCDVTTTCTNGNATTAIGTVMMDQMSEARILSITGDATGDALTVGQSGSALGLRARLASVNDVKSIINVANGTEAAAVAVSSTSIDVANSALIGITVAATDNWHVDYFALGDDGVGENGGVA